MAVSYPCYFGAWDPANDNFTDWSGMQKFSAAPIKSSSMYIGWNTPYSYFGAFNDLCAANGAVMYLNIEPWNAYGGGSTPTMAQIGNGAGDAYLTQLATDLKNAGHPVLMCFAHEMNGTWYPWGAQAISASQWVITWKHVYTVMKNVMGSLLTAVWCPNNNDVGAVSPYWPGSAYVDLAAADMYINNTGQTFASFNQGTLTEILGLNGGGPVWNAETGIVLGTYSISSWVSDMASAGLYGFTIFNEGSFALSAGNIATLCAGVNAWNNAAPGSGGNAVVTSTGGLVRNPPTFNGATSGNSNPGGSQNISYTAEPSTQVAATAGVAKTTATVSPTAGSMVLLCVSWMAYTNEAGLTFTVQDNLGNIYREAAVESDAFGSVYSVVFEFQYKTAPGAVSFVVTASNQGVADCLVQPYLITGQATDQTKAATAKANASSSSGVCSVSIQNTVVGSYMFAVGSIGLNTTPTAVAGTTTDANWNDTSSGDQSVIGHSTSATTSIGVSTIGWTQAPAGSFGYGICVVEVVPASTNSTSPGGNLNIVTGTPDNVHTVSGVATQATSFSPTAGSMARICATWLDSVDQLGKTFTCADNHGNTYRATLAGGDSDGGCYLLIFDYVYSAAPGATIVTITAAGTGATATADCLIEPYIVTGQAANPYGATNSVFGNTSISTCQISLTTTQVGSRVWVLGAPNNANHPVPTALPSTVTDAEWDDDGVGSHGVIGKSASATSTPGPTTYGWTLSTASIYGFGCIAAEIVPATSVSSGLVRSAPAMAGTGAVTGGVSFTASGTVGSATANGFALAPTSANAGDFILLGVWSETAADYATALSGSNVAWSVLVAHTSFTAQAGVETVFKGQPSSTTSAAQTITFSAGSPVIRVAWQEFHASAGFTTVALDASGTVDTASNGYYPPVTPTRAGDLYWSFCFDSNTAANGNTANCVYQADANGNGMVYCLASPNATLQPNTGNTDGLSGIGVMLYQNVVNLVGNVVRSAPAMSGTGTTSIVNVSGTGSLQLGANKYAGSTNSDGTTNPVTGQVATTFPGNLLNIKAEILINGAWIDISQYVYMRNDMIISRGLPDETQEAVPSSMTFTLNNRDGRFSASNPNGAYAPYLTRNTQVRFSVVNQASNAGFIYSGYRFWGELANIPPSWDSTGRDVYVQAVINGPLRRYIQGSKMGSALYQYYSSLAGGNLAPYAAWPAEDGSQATEIASMLPGFLSMAITGKPSMSQSSAFGGSDALPELTGSTWHGQTTAAADPAGSGSILNNSPGTYQWICPPGVTAITNVLAVGSGGGGGDTDGTTGGSGGGGGGAGFAASLSVTPGRTYTYIVPAPGTPGSSGPGTAGSPAAFTADTGSVAGNGGAGGAYAGGPGGAGGTGSSYSGGAGAVGQSSTTANFQNTIYGGSGSNGNGTGATAGNNSTSWTAPPTVTTVTVNALAAGGGASAGRGNSGSVGGGGGGGGGAFATGTITVTPGHTYSPYAGNGGSGGSGSPGGGYPGPSNSHGDIGGNSGMAGDSGSSVVAGGGGGGASTTAGLGGNVVSGGGNSGGQGGTGTQQVHGGGGSGGGPGSSGSFGANGANGDGDSGGANRVAGDGGSVGNAGNSGSEYGNAGAGGGGGGCSATLNENGFYGPSGGGGSGGWTNWQWTVTGAPIGGGGGGAAGSSSGGGSGSTTGSGGSSPSGGTGGSAGGSPAGLGSGGGGAGATPSNSTVGNAASNAGSGSPGSVGFSWSGGTTSPVANDYIRFCLDVNATGTTDGAVIFRALTYGTIARLDVVYHTGGKLELIGYNSSSAQLFDSGAIAFSADGNPLYISLELVTSGSIVNWAIKGIAPGGTQLAASGSGSLAGFVGNVSDVLVNPNGTITDDTAVGWITVQTYADTLLNISKIVSGYSGELAADRMARLCASQSLGFSLVGVNTDTPQMGPQQDDNFLNVLQSCADLDRGQLFETIDSFGIGYRTRKSMQGQAPKVIASYSGGTLATAPQPVADDQYTRNDITMTRNNGASARVTIKTGPMSIQNPPNGVGDYTYGQTVYAYADTQLTGLAQWVAYLGTVPGYRFPQITFDMSRAAVGSIFSTIPTLDIGDYLQIPDPPVFLQTSPISQLIWGYTETFNSRKWIFQYNAVPEAPYAMPNPPTW